MRESIPPPTPSPFTPTAEVATPPDPLNPEQADATAKPLFEHLSELRSRLCKSFLILLVATVLCYNFVEQLFVLLSAPHFAAFPNSPLIGTGPAEAFLLKIKIAIFAGLVVSLPLIFLQLWGFIAPGLHKHEKLLVVPFVAVGSLLFILGVTFCYSVIIPVIFGFFAQEYAQTPGLTSQIRFSEHIELMMQLMVAFGVVFEMPVAAFALAKMGLLTAKGMRGSFRYSVLIIFVVAAMLTPPDVVSMCLMAGPMLLLYGVSYLLVKSVGMRAESTTVKP